MSEYNVPSKNTVYTMKDEFQTSDLWLSAYLSINGEVIKNILKDGRRAVFIFKNTDQLSKLIVDFANDLPNTSPITFLQKIKSLKKAIDFQ